MSPFRLQTLGGLTLTDSATGQRIGTPRRKPLALLALLAAAGDAGADREWIAAMLWPELDATRARRVLAQTVYALRRELHAPEAVLGTARLCANERVVRSDLHELRAATTGATRRDAWRRAAELYAGPFLEGVHFPGCVELERWSETMRARLARVHQGVLRDLASDAARAGEPAGAVHWLETAVAAYPLDSELAGGLADAYAAAGRPGQALAVLRAHAATLRAELDVALPSALAALGERLASREQAAAIPRVQAPRAEALIEPSRTVVAAAPASHSGWRERGRAARAAVLAAALALVAREGVAWWSAMRAPASLAEALTAEREATEDDALDGLEAPARKRLLVLTPVNGTGNPGHDTLAPIVARTIGARLAASGVHVVPRESVAVVERSARGTTGGHRLAAAYHALRGADAPLALSSSYALRADSLLLTVAVLRRVALPADTTRRSLMWRLTGRVPRRDGVESFGLVATTAPVRASLPVLDSVGKTVQSAVLGMASCEVGSHLAPHTLPWCWEDDRVRLVRGALRARVRSRQVFSIDSWTYEP